MIPTIAEDFRKDLKQLSDSEIIKIILEKEKTDLLAILYHRYSAKIYHKCLRLTGDHTTAQDLMHDIMIKIFVNLPRFRGTANFSFWVNAITHNYCIDFLKKKKRMRFEELEDSNFISPSIENVEPENQALHDLRLSQLEHLMKTLKQDDRQLLQMRFQNKMPIKEISQLLKISESAVKMRLRRGLDRLSKDMTKIQHENDE